MWRRGGEPALVTAVIALDVVTAVTTVNDADRPLLPFGLILIMVSSVALLWRRRFPYPVLALTAATALVYYPLGFPDAPVVLSLVIALYTVARDRGPKPAAAVALTLVAVFAGFGGQDRFAALIGIAPLLLLPVVLGEVARGRAREAARAEERAAQRRAAEERLRIARELHDVLAHQLSLITVQAGAALHTGEPDGAFEALRTIRTASKGALREMRSVLGVLREAEPPGLADLPELFDRTSAAGLTVRATVDAADLTAPVQQAAYRIVQEALTNAVRHAAATSADVEIRRAGETVVVTIADDGPPVGTVVGEGPPVGVDVEGNGMRGMAERVAALGGEFGAGPRPGGGFRVAAILPTTKGTP